MLLMDLILTDRQTDRQVIYVFAYIYKVIARRSTFHNHLTSSQAVCNLHEQFNQTMVVQCKDQTCSGLSWHRRLCFGGILDLGAG